MKNVNIKSEWIEIISNFAPEIRGQVWDAVINYCSFNTLPENLPDAARMAFLFIKREIDKGRAQRERARARAAQKAAKPEIGNVAVSQPSSEEKSVIENGNVDIVLTDMGANPWKVKKILHDLLQYASAAGDFDRFQSSPAPWILARNISKEKATIVKKRLAEVNASSRICPTRSSVETRIA